MDKKSLKLAVKAFKKLEELTGILSESFGDGREGKAGRCIGKAEDYLGNVLMNQLGLDWDSDYDVDAFFRAIHSGAGVKKICKELESLPSSHGPGGFSGEIQGREDLS